VIYDFGLISSKSIFSCRGTNATRVYHLPHGGLQIFLSPESPRVTRPHLHTHEALKLIAPGKLTFDETRLKNNYLADCEVVPRRSRI